MNKPILAWAILLLSVLNVHAKTTSNVVAGIDADFEADVTVICAGGTVNFTDLTTSNPTGWTWTFEGGTPDTSTLQNPAVVYNTPGVYTVHLKANNGIEGDEEVKVEYIKVQFTPSSSFHIATASAQCLNGNSFTFENTGSSGTHLWGFAGGSPINSTAVNPTGIVFSGAGIHTVSHKVTDGDCFSVTIQDVTLLSNPTALAVTTTASHCAGSTGTITMGAVTAGTAPFTYSVNGSSFSSQTTYSGFPPGTYSVTVKDANGCTFTRTATVGSSSGPASASVTITPSTCGNANGIITVNSVTGGTPPYQYAVDNSALQSSATFNTILAGAHQLKVKDANGCQLTQNFTMTNTFPSAIAITTTPSDCAPPNGTISLGAVTGGRAPYTYSVDGNAFSVATLYGGKAAGPHTVVVKDVTGCTLTVTTTVTAVAGPTSFASTSTASKCSPPTGSISVQTPVGGQAPFTYSFNGGAFASTTTFTGLAAGTYTVVAKDGNGCTISQNITVQNTPPPTAINITTSASACLASTGSLTLGTVTGGTAPYTYSVNGSAFTTTTTYTGLATGTHTVVVRDANACTFTTTVTISGTQPTAVSITTTPSSCTATGSISIGAVTGGANPFVYSVNNSAFTSATVYNNRPAGTYTVSVKDFNGCIFTQTVTIASTAPTAVSVSSTATPCGVSGGAVTVSSVTGGVSPITYSINNSAFTGTTSYTNLAAGLYTIVAKDANGCTVSASITVASESGPTALVVTNTGATCGTNNGTITIGAVTGGSSPFTYSIDNGAFTGTTAYSNIAPGTHSVRVRDAAGCIFTVATVLTSSPGPTDVVLTTTNAVCGNNNGSITAGAVTGGTGPFTYALNGGAFTGTTSYTGLSAGTYTITVRDANNCVFNKTRTITSVAGPTAINFDMRHNGCTVTPNTGFVSVNSVTGGTAPYTYSFNGSAFTSTSSYSGLSAGTYVLIAKDVNGCTVSHTITINNVATGPNGFTASEVDPACGQSNGSIVITSVSGGTAPYEYRLGAASSFTTNNTYTGLPAGFYSLSIRDVNGCVTGFGQAPTLVSPGGPSAFNYSSTNSTCQQPNGSITVTSVTGGAPPYQYSLNGGAFQGSTTFNAVQGGILMPMVVRDANGCTFTASVLTNNTGAAVPAPAITQNGFLLSASGASGHQWFLNGVAISGATGTTHFAQFNGSYTVTRTSGSCTSPPSNTIVITNQSQRITNELARATTPGENNDDTRTEAAAPEIAAGTALNAYPNPNDGVFTVSFNAHEATVYTLEVVNVFGQVVFAEQVSGQSGTYVKQLDMNEYGPGLYTIILTSPEERTVQKIVTH